MEHAAKNGNGISFYEIKMSWPTVYLVNASRQLAFYVTGLGLALKSVIV